MTRKTFLRDCIIARTAISAVTVWSEQRYTYESSEDIFTVIRDGCMDRIDQLEWDMKMIAGKTPYAAIQYIRKSIGYDAFLKEYALRRRRSIRMKKRCVR